MAVTPRSFLRNPLLLILLLGFSVAAYGMFFDCPTQSACSYSKTVKRTSNADALKAQQAAKQVEKKAEKTSQKGWLGVQIRTLRPNTAKALGANPNLRGVHIMALQNGKPAQFAGMLRNDIVTHFNGKRVTTSCQLKKNVLATAPGTRVPVRVIRDGKPLTLYPELTKAPGKSCGSK